MSIDIIPINGTSQYLDYGKFESTLKAKISRRCSDAKVFLLNNFPVPVSVETNIDLIIIIVIEDKKGNFYIPKSIDDKPIYFHNQIIPIKFVTQFKNNKISFEDKHIISEESFLDYSTEIYSIKYGLSKYLSSKCGLNKGLMYIKPLVFIQNENEFVIDNYLVAESFDFNSLHRYFLQCNEGIFISYKEWRSELGYSFLASDMERIADQASKDSQDGYLTRKKIERIGKQLSNSRTIFEQLNKNLIIISGKAGTGKSSELLLLTMKSISNGQNTLYLTYNKILIFDISKTIKSLSNAKIISDSGEKVGEASVMTLHQFFFRLSRSLGVLHILSEDRIKKLLTVLRTRMRLVYDFISKEISSNELLWENLKTEIQNHNLFDIGTKEVGIDLINFTQKKTNNLTTEQVKKQSIEFYNYKKKIIGNIGANQIFLADYYGVLEDLLLAIQDEQKYFTKYNLQDKYDLLEVILSLREKHIEEHEDGIKIKPNGFYEHKNRSIGGYRRKRTLFIDEAQDCHHLEKEILFSIYSAKNIVVANGGKEQLIRHVELCNWERSLVGDINFKKHYMKTKSYRVKRTVSSFCNFVAKRYHIDLNLEPLESEDDGELLFDFRENHLETEIKEIFVPLTLKGEVNGCSSYESLLILLESNSQRIGLDGQPEHMIDSAIINEYGNIDDAAHLRRGTWKHLSTLEKSSFMFWDGTGEDKSQLAVPSPNESRIIYYESCRGLEAWSVACFSLDKFFDQKKEDPDAEKFLIDDNEKTKLMQDMFKASNEDRKNMYAATWVLMAMTRTIDSLYVQINDRSSEFGKVVDEYLKQGNRNVRQLYTR